MRECGVAHLCRLVLYLLTMVDVDVVVIEEKVLAQLAAEWRRIGGGFTHCGMLREQLTLIQRGIRLRVQEVPRQRWSNCRMMSITIPCNGSIGQWMQLKTLRSCEEFI